MFEPWLQRLSALLGSIVAILSYQIIHGAGLPFLSPILASLIGALATTVSIWGMMRLPKHFPKGRHLVDSRAIFEGVWIQSFIKGTNVKQLTILDIRYDFDSDQYEVSGIAYSCVGLVRGSFVGENVQFDFKTKTMSYFWRGLSRNFMRPVTSEIVDDLNGDNEETSRSSMLTNADSGVGTTSLRLVYSGGQVPINGIGAITSTNRPGIVEFSVRKIDNELLSRLQGELKGEFKLHDSDTHGELIRAYYRYRKGLLEIPAPHLEE